MPRLFIGLDLPDAIKASIHRLGSGLPGANFVPSENLHMTLRFIGDVDGTLYNDIADQLTLLSHDPIQLTLQGMGVFPNHGEPKILWIGVAANAALQSLQQKIQNLLKPLKLPAEKRGFMPHITLARLQQCPPQRLADYMAEHHEFTSSPIGIEEFHLYSSQRGTKGSHYTQEYTYPLVDHSGLSFLEKWRRGLIN